MFWLLRYTARVGFRLVTGMVVVAGLVLVAALGMSAVRGVLAAGLESSNSPTVFRDSDGNEYSVDAGKQGDGTVESRVEVKTAKSDVTDVDSVHDVLDDVFRQAAVLPRNRRRGFLLKRAGDLNLTVEAAHKIQAVASLVD